MPAILSGIVSQDTSYRALVLILTLTVHESRAISRFLVRDNYQDNNMYYTLSQEIGNEVRAHQKVRLEVELMVPPARKYVLAQSADTEAARKPSVSCREYGGNVHLSRKEKYEERQGCGYVASRSIPDIRRFTPKRACE